MLPNLAQPLSFKEILKQNIEYIKQIIPDYTPVVGDNIMLTIQAFSYREMLLREFINYEVRGNFLDTAEEEKLDHLAETLYGIYRLQGSKPYAKMRFYLLKPLLYDVIIPEGYELLEDTGVFSSFLTQKIVIPAGETEAVATVELNRIVASSKVKTEIPVQPLPYLKVEQLEDFTGGGDVESDDELKERIRVSLSNKTTAGAKNTYISFALRADERIEDVFVYSPVAGVVRVIYYSKTVDSLMQQRVEETLNSSENRPLTDKVEVSPAKEIYIDIEAVLVVSKYYVADMADILIEARRKIEQLFEKTQIAKDITKAQIISALMGEGVENIEMKFDDIKIGTEEIAILGELNISTKESEDEY